MYGQSNLWPVQALTADNAHAYYSIQKVFVQVRIRSGKNVFDFHIYDCGKRIYGLSSRKLVNVIMS